MPTDVIQEEQRVHELIDRLNQDTTRAERKRPCSFNVSASDRPNSETVEVCTRTMRFLGNIALRTGTMPLPKLSPSPVSFPVWHLRTRRWAAAGRRFTAAFGADRFRLAGVVRTSYPTAHD